ncbi:MAG: hypothetical protein ACOX2K_01185 [Bacillota bacterium]
MQMNLRLRIAMISLLLIVALVFTGWLIWSLSVQRTPRGAILVWHELEQPLSPRWEHPFQIIVTRRVIV